MRTYDINLPLIVIHIPKTARVSVHEIYGGWFSDRLLLHYFNVRTEEMPIKYDLVGMHTKEQPIALFGHFNHEREFGIEQYYPKAKQFITIFRDPFERVISAYSYVRKQKENWKDQSKIPKNKLRDFILNVKGNMLNFFGTFSVQVQLNFKWATNQKFV